MSGQLRSSDGRFAGGFAQIADTILRSGVDAHERTFLDDAEPLSWMADAERAESGEKYLYAAAICGEVFWTDVERPTRRVVVHYVDPAREYMVAREVPGRLGCTDGQVHVASVEWDAIPRRIAVAPGKRRALDADGDEYAAYGDALRAHEEDRR